MEQLSSAAQDGLQLAQDRLQASQIPRVGARALQSVEGDGHHPFVTELAGRRQRAAGLVEGDVEPQPVDPHHGEAAEDVHLGRSVLDGGRDLQGGFPVGDARARGPTQSDEKVTTQLPQGVQLDGTLPRLPGLLHGQRLVLEGALELGQPLPGPAAGHPDLGLRAGVLDDLRCLQGPVQQLLRIAVGEPRRGPLRRLDPRVPGLHPVPGRAGVDGDRFRVACEKRGGPPVPGNADGQRRGAVQDLPDQVVGELVGGTGLHQEPGPSGLLGPASRILERRLEQPSHDGYVERAAQGGGHPEELLDVRTGPPHPPLDHATKGLGDRGLRPRPVPDGPEDLHDEQRVSSRERHQARGHRRGPHATGQRRHRGLWERPDVDPPAHVLELGEGALSFLQAHRRQDQQSRPLCPPLEEVEELERRRARVMEVVEEEKDGFSPRQGTEERRQPLEGPAAFDLGRRSLVGKRPEDPADLGDQVGQGPRPLPGQLLHRFGRGGDHDRADRVDQGLQEQRPLRVVAAGVGHGAPGATGEADGRLGQCGLPDAGLADQQQHRPLADQRLLPPPRDLFQFLPSADEAGVGSFGAGLRGRCGPAEQPRNRLGVDRLFTEDRQMQGLGLRRGIRPHVLRQDGTKTLVGRQGLTRAAGPMHGQHHRAVGLLVQGILRDPSLGNLGGAVELRELHGGHPAAPAGSPEQGRRRVPGGRGPLRVGLVFQCAAGPQQHERSIGRPTRQRGLAGRQASLRLRDQPLRLVEVDVEAVAGNEAIASCAARDGLRPEHGAEAADQRGEVTVPLRWRLVAPQGFGDPVAGNDVVPFQDQDLQQRPALPAADLLGPEGSSILRDAKPTDQVDAEAGRHVPARPIRGGRGRPRRPRPPA